MKTVSKWQRLQLKTKILKLVKYLDEGVKLALLFDITFSNSSKQFQNNILRPNNKRKFETWNHVFFFEVKMLIFCHFSKIWKFKIPCGVIKSKLGPKGVKFLHYIPTVIKRSTSIILVFSRLQFHFWDVF